MLSPRYLDGLSDEIVEIYSQLESDILCDMARRIARLGKVTDATKWQAEMFTENGGLKGDIQKILKKYDKEITQKVADTVKNAMEKSTEIDNSIFEKATGRKVSTPNAQVMLSLIQKCHSDLARLTLTTAETTEKEFVKQANRVYMQTESGAFSYDEAMKNACRELAGRGITTVQYNNTKPVTRSIESAVRMNIITSINQNAANITLNNCEELDCDLVETTAHVGSRPEHEAWQGKIFSKSGKSTKYPPFSTCELGSVTGICGINCRHSFYPYFEGMEKHYTKNDLDKLANVKVEYNGKKMTRYEGEQQLRGIERNIRKYKRLSLTQEAGGVDATSARRKLGEWQEEARNFTKQTGLTRDSSREWIGTKDGVQPRGITEKKNNNIYFGKQVMPTAKFVDYALNPQKDANKAVAFEKALGYTKGNIDVLIDKLKNAIDERNFVEKGDKGHGMRYEQIVEIEGVNGKKANVLTSWIQDGKKRRLTSIYVTNKGVTK